MKRSIIVTIEPDADGARCGECCGVSTDPDNEYCAWAVQHWDETHKGPFLKNLGDTRGPECLAAERLLRELVEAGQAMFDEDKDCSQIERDANGARWDDAVKALEGE